MNNQALVIAWGMEQLLANGYQIKNTPEIVIETPWSTVIRFLTSKGHCYVKQTPVNLFIETDVVKAIQKKVSDSLTPEILFLNPELNCFLMLSCGDYSLRTKFNGTIDVDLLIQGLHSYIRIQRSLANNLDTFEAIGVPNWRTSHIPELYSDLLKNKEFLLDEGLTLHELDKLMELIPAIKSICEFLAKQTIQDTLINADFNENNMIINETTQQISLIDWGESVITHPFFSIASHLHATARRYQLEPNGELIEKIKQKYLSCWLDMANQQTLDEIYLHVLRLLPIFSSLALYRLQTATNNRSKTMQRWFIASTLQRLLKNE